jgi:hypothetical protein
MRMLHAEKFYHPENQELSLTIVPTYKNYNWDCFVGYSFTTANEGIIR